MGVAVGGLGLQGSPTAHWADPQRPGKLVVLQHQHAQTLSTCQEITISHICQPFFLQCIQRGGTHAANQQDAKRLQQACRQKMSAAFMHMTDCVV